MRKILNSLLLLSLLLVLNVKADMGPPVLPILEMEVSNPYGAKCYDSDSKVNRTLKYGELVYGYIDDTDLYDDNFKKDYYQLSFNEGEVIYCYVKKTDVVVKQDNFKPSEDDKEKGPFALWALKDIKIYSGPSKNFYKEIGSIPKDSKLESSYKLGDYWYYVTYNGITGYISGESQDLINKITETIVMYEPNDYKIESGKVTIPAGEEFKEYWVTDYERVVYVVYNGKLVNTTIHKVGDYNYFATKCNGSKIEALKELPVYSYENNIKKKINTLEVNKKYDVEYCFQGYRENREAYYIPSLKGWIDEEYGGDGEEVRSPIVFYDKDGNSNRDEQEDPKQEEPTEKPKNPGDVQPPTPKPEPTPDDKKGLTNDELIMICVGAGILIAVTILVVIKLVNKKKNSEVDPIQNNNDNSNLE